MSFNWQVEHLEHQVKGRPVDWMKGSAPVVLSATEQLVWKTTPEEKFVTPNERIKDADGATGSRLVS